MHTSVNSTRNLNSTGDAVPPENGSHTRSLILLHGYCSNGPEFESEFLESQDSLSRELTSIFPSINFIFPSAPFFHSEEFNMRQWFPLSDSDFENLGKTGLSHDEGRLNQVRDSIRLVKSIVEGESAKFGKNNVILGGISQGYMVALLTFLFGKIDGVAGFWGSCGWLPFENLLREGRSEEGLLNRLNAVSQELGIPAEGSTTTNMTQQHLENLAKIPMLIQHCADDDVVSLENGVKLSKALEELGMNINFVQYEKGGHWLNEPAGVDDLVSFLQGALK